jgi:hypothetical protein
VYAQLSDVLQIELHAALSRQETAPVALARAAQQMRAVLQEAGLGRGVTAPATPARWPFAVAAALALAPRAAPPPRPLVRRSGGFRLSGACAPGSSAQRRCFPPPG